MSRSDLRKEIEKISEDIEKLIKEYPDWTVVVDGLTEVQEHILQAMIELDDEEEESPR